MNATKWNELRNAMLNEMPFPPPYCIKLLVDDTVSEDDFSCDVCYHGDWNEVFMIDGAALNASFAVEWIKIRPRFIRRRGRLVEPETVDCEEAFIAVLQKYSIPYESNGGAYFIYGYR